MARIHIADDDPVIGVFVKMILEGAGHEVRVFEDGPPILDAIRESAPDLLMTDLNMISMDGFGVLSATRELHPHLPVVMITGSSELSDAIRALRAGAADYIPKPVDPDLLGQVVDRVLRMAALEREVRRANAEIAARDETLRQELSIASTIQRALLPESAPLVPGLETGLAFATAGEIGGDYFSFSASDDPARLGILLSDITGHGIPAALLFCLFKQIVDPLFGVDSGIAPSEAMKVLNRRVAKDFPTGHFASTLYAEIDVASRTLRCVKGGQEPVLVARDGEIVATLSDGGPLIGAFDPDIFGDGDYAETTLRLQPNDLVLLYTDGLIEATNASGDQAGPSALAKWIKEDFARTPADLTARLLGRVSAWTGRTSLDDDVTAIAVRIP